MKKVKKVWGSEEWIVNTKDYCGKLLNLKQGYCCSLHYHKKKDETFYVNSGCIILEIEDSKIIMGAGESYRIKPKSKHRFSGIVDSQIIEFSTHHEDKDSIRDTKSGKMDKSFYLAEPKIMNELIKASKKDIIKNSIKYNGQIIHKKKNTR